jgi:hypothetical protein
LHVLALFRGRFRVARCSLLLPAISARYAALQITPRNTDATSQFAFRSREGRMIALLALLLLAGLCVFAFAMVGAWIDSKAETWRK